MLENSMRECFKEKERLNMIMEMPMKGSLRII
jgi:hypothetical protein